MFFGFGDILYNSFLVKVNLENFRDKEIYSRAGVVGLVRIREFRLG